MAMALAGSNPAPLPFVTRLQLEVSVGQGPTVTVPDAIVSRLLLALLADNPDLFDLLDDYCNSGFGKDE